MTKVVVAGAELRSAAAICRWVVMKGISRPSRGSDSDCDKQVAPVISSSRWCCRGRRLQTLLKDVRSCESFVELWRLRPQHASAGTHRITLRLSRPRCARRGCSS
jgi:hypothetical protein